MRAIYWDSVLAVDVDLVSFHGRYRGCLACQVSGQDVAGHKVIFPSHHSCRRVTT
jgi:hypothetical protein